MNLSKNFTLAELCVTNTGLKNIPGTLETQKLILLTDNVLQPLRDKVGKPLTINSGFRSFEVNKVVGGELTSQHRRGEAADISAIKEKDGFTPAELLHVLLESGIDFDQAITYDNFMHVSFRASRNRKMVIRK